MLAQGACAAGRHEASWDGRDTRGARSRAGMYYVRLAVADANGEETRVQKIVLMR
jgi:flagellar hook assembly protein FlgD